MLSPIKLDHQARFDADEIHDVAFQWILPAEFPAPHLAHAQVTPRMTLGVGGAIAQDSGSMPALVHDQEFMDGVSVSLDSFFLDVCRWWTFAL